MISRARRATLETVLWVTLLACSPVIENAAQLSAQTVLALAMFVMGDAEVGGNLCLTGWAHINGDAAGNNGYGSPQFTCDGEYTEGFSLTTPETFTDPAHFPGATYYYVKGYRVGGSTYSARIFDENLVDVTGTTDMSTLTSYNSATKTYTFRFDSHARIIQYFNDAGGTFSRSGGDSAVVVNFGELPLGPTGALYQALIFDGNASSNIHATIINSRFEGTSLSQRLRSSYWRGAKLEVKQCIFEPYFGIAMICHDLERTGSAPAYLGTSDYPALVHVTQDVITINSNFSIAGILVCLRDFHSTGGPTITFDPRCLEQLPAYLQDVVPFLGACCADFSCSFTGPVECDVLGRWHQGPSTTCEPNPCLTAEIDSDGVPSPRRQLAAYPNPFTDRISVRLVLESPGTGHVEIVDAMGRAVRSSLCAPGLDGELNFDGTDDSGCEVPCGVYFIRYQVEDSLWTVPITRLR